MLRRWEKKGLAVICFLVNFTVSVHAAEPSDWRQTAYSIAAGQIGAVNAYRIEDDLIWRRIDDSRFAAFKGMQLPTDASDWSVKFFYRSDVFPRYGSASLSQDYSSMQLGYETGRVWNWRGGTMRQGLFYLSGSSNAYLSSYDSGDISYGGASSAMKKYGAAWYTSWEGADSHRIEGVFRVTSLRNHLSYTDEAGQSRSEAYRTWMPALGLRWYQTKFAADSFFWEPQVGVSFGYMNLPSVGSTAVYTPKNQTLLTGKAGLMAGKTYRIRGNQGLAYGRFEVQRDFTGPLYGEGKNVQSGDSASVSLGSGPSSWYNMTVGTSFTMGQGNTIWGELTRRFGSDMKQTWSVTGGLVLRWGGAKKEDREEFKKLKEDERSLKHDKDANKEAKK